MKQANAAWRKAGKPGPCAANATPEAGTRWRAQWQQVAEACNWTDEKLLAILKSVSIQPYHKGPFPGYALTNLGAQIRTDKKRIKEVKRRAERQAEAEAAGGVVVKTAGPAGEWCAVTFAEKPERSVLDALKAAGFGWGGGSWSGRTENLPEAVKALV